LVVTYSIGQARNLLSKLCSNYLDVAAVAPDEQERSWTNTFIAQKIADWSKCPEYVQSEAAYGVQADHFRKRIR
jgi:hypothetical protein